MKKAILVFMIGMGMVVVSGCSKKSSDDTAVKGCYGAYQASVDAKDGAGAWEIVSQATRACYGKVLADALTLSGEGFKDADITTKVMVLRIRHEFKKERLEGMTGESLFKVSVEKGWVANSGVEELDGMTVKVENDLARLYAEGEAETVIATFVREDGVWRYDLVAGFDVVNETVGNMIKVTGMREKDFFMQMLAGISTKPVDERIFEGPLD